MSLFQHCSMASKTTWETFRWKFDVGVELISKKLTHASSTGVAVNKKKIKKIYSIDLYQRLHIIEKEATHTVKSILQSGTRVFAIFYKISFNFRDCIRDWTLIEPGL